MKSNIISVGIFFDGTGNNGINATSHEKPPKNNESYYGNTTNIYKLFQLFNGEEKLYIEGIGTVTQKEDSDFAMATCKNPAGYHGFSSDDKLQKAFSFIEQIMSDRTNHYEFYIYGFSRGAMLARNFCYELLKKYTHFQEDVTVKFLGVFDTVESAPFNDYNITVHPATERAFHICATNECRFFFPLSGLFEDSCLMEDKIAETEHTIWKKIFVPGAHADVGGGYLEGPQSVYISPNFLLEGELNNYIQNIRTSVVDAEGNKIWNYLLDNYKVDPGEVFCQAYISKDHVYNELSKVYGKLMLKESNAEKKVFNTEFDDCDFLINPDKHPYLIRLSAELERYTEKLSPQLKPVYNYKKLTDYTHISANFGLYHPAIPKNSAKEDFTEFINNGLNVPGNSDDQFTANPSKLQVEIHHIEDSVVDYAYGTNIPNNDNWSRTILIKENLYNKC
ncbi:T6SS phospholipase effector Tle1-like catalytic domain-containing protein [Chryseobacterium profundimaris]|uniref:Uncharacterized alpha/beta hydrolase domain n=1 Tax=Chryseobacterium profundimaris TaxID=1387275 RepID=A0ABY1PF54_9FLAO|nr:DUF2235 domain-containing protein [Chryseobacterium profundimaris]SMP32281.1 Uncharacterized alpha/beta hydrolase domain [Chryseobacterium profundimaris]